MEVYVFYEIKQVVNQVVLMQLYNVYDRNNKGKVNRFKSKVVYE